LKLGWLQTKTKERVWFLFMKVVVMEVKFAQLMETMYQELVFRPPNARLVMLNTLPD